MCFFPPAPAFTCGVVVLVLVDPAKLMIIQEIDSPILKHALTSLMHILEWYAVSLLGILCVGLTVNSLSILNAMANVVIFYYCWKHSTKWRYPCFINPVHH